MVAERSDVTAALETDMNGCKQDELFTFIEEE